MTTRRKFFLGSGLAATAALAEFSVYEPNFPVVETKRVEVFRGLGTKPVRLVQLSDLHFSWCVTYRMIRSAFEQALDCKPDLVCITGDFVTRVQNQDLSGYPELLQMLSSRVPTYAVKGNHDGGHWSRSYLGDHGNGVVEQALAAAGVKLLFNAAEQIRAHGQEFWLAGVGDLWSRDIDAAKTWKPIPPAEPVVLLSHNPDSKTVLAQAPWKIMLSGHTHGGQTTVPYFQEYFAPVEDKRFLAGMNAWREAPGGARWIHTSRGIGNLGGMRVLCRPEISVLELV